MDLSQSIQSKSDQMDYQDFLGGPRTVAIVEVRRGPSPEQPVEIVLEGLERPWRPAKSMTRVLVAAWGADSSQYAGRQVTVFGDPTVKWGGVAVGGIRLSHLSHIDKPLTVSLTTTRGKRAPFTVQPLAARPAATEQPAQPSTRDFLAEATAAASVDDIKAIWMDAQAAGATQDLLASIFELAPKEQS